MKITSVTSPFNVDSARFMIVSVMSLAAANCFVFTAGGLTTSNNAVNIIVNNDNISLESIGTLANAAFADLVELAVVVTGGRYEIAELTTDNLPGNRKSWGDFGQLCEDVFLGRIPELLSASMLVLDQVHNKLYWGGIVESDLAQTDILADPDYTNIGIFSGTEAKTSENFFE